jgi:hypothetical protein
MPRRLRSACFHCRPFPFPPQMSSSKLSFLSLFLICSTLSHGWVLPPQTALSRRPAARNSPSTLNGVFDFLSPYESKIPDELRDEIYQAEANTPAATDRGQRVALFALIAFVGILCAFFNGFLTELRANGPDGSPGVDLTEAGFGWVLGNFLFSFLFTNKIGGGICLLGGAGAGLLAEAELDSKRINAEKIYEELERRRNAKTKPKKKAAPKKKKRQSGKEKKRLSALSEVVVEEAAGPTEVEEPEATGVDSAEETNDEKAEKTGKGMFDGIKNLYNQADTIAASQALLLNKQFEEFGIVDKITDETGLKVIGKEAAEKLSKEKENDSETLEETK